MRAVNYNLKHVKETKGTHLYKGEGNGGREIAFYLPKSDIDGLPPRNITLTVEPNGASAVEAASEN
jgi:hypothetical protein